MPVSQQIYRILSVIHLVWKAMPKLWVLLESVARLLSVAIKYLKTDESHQQPSQQSSLAPLMEVKSWLPRFLDFYYEQGKKNSESDLRLIETSETSVRCQNKLGSR